MRGSIIQMNSMERELERLNEIDELRKVNLASRNEIARLKSEFQTMRAALEWYEQCSQDEFTLDSGQRARRALGK